MSKPSTWSREERGPWAPFVWARHAFHSVRHASSACTGLLHRVLLYFAPEELRPGEVAPWTALFRPGPCTAWFLMVWNDHIAKGSEWWPSSIAGKLSDFAGLAFFPLLLVTCFNTGMFFVRRWLPCVSPWSSLHLRQLQFSCILTGSVFAAIQLSPAVAELYRQICVGLVPWDDGRMVRVVSDPSDLWALFALGWAYRWGQSAIAQVPPGRLGLAELCARAHARSSMARRRIAIRRIFQDIRHCQPPWVAREMGCLEEAFIHGASEAERVVCVRNLRVALQRGLRTCNLPVDCD